MELANTKDTKGGPKMPDGLTAREKVMWNEAHGKAPKSKAPKFQPTFNNVVVQRDATKNESPIILPDSVKPPPARGVVLAVGPGKYEGGVLVPTTVKAGEHVAFHRYAGTEIDKVDGRQVLIMPETEIMAKLG